MMSQAETQQRSGSGEDLALNTIPLQWKTVPSEELNSEEQKALPLFVPLGKVPFEPLLKCILALSDDDWTRQPGNVRLKRAFHDALGISSIQFCFTDDIFTKVFRLPFWNSWSSLLNPIFDAIGVQPKTVVRCLLAKLPPGIQIGAHHDTGRWTQRTHRVHVPLVTSGQHGDESEEVVFKVGSTIASLARVAFEQGVAVELNNRAKHEVCNNSPIARIHLIFDWVSIDEVGSLSELYIAPGQRIVQHRRVIHVHSDGDTMELAPPPVSVKLPQAETARRIVLLQTLLSREAKRNDSDDDSSMLERFTKSTRRYAQARVFMVFANSFGVTS